MNITMISIFRSSSFLLNRNSVCDRSEQNTNVILSQILHCTSVSRCSKGSRRRELNGLSLTVIGAHHPSHRSPSLFHDERWFVDRRNFSWIYFPERISTTVISIECITDVSQSETWTAFRLVGSLRPVMERAVCRIECIGGILFANRDWWR